MKLRPLICLAFLFVLGPLMAAADQGGVHQPAAGGKSGPSTAIWQAKAALYQGDEGTARGLLNRLATTSGHGPFEQLTAARILAEGAVRYNDPQLAAAAERRLATIEGWLSDYGQTVPVHGFNEPAWVRGQAGAVAEAVMAYARLEGWQPNPSRRDKLQKFAQGLAMLERKEVQQYPFKAHTSLAGLGQNYVPSQSGPAPGALWVTEQSRQVSALAEASRVLQEPDLLAAAEREALGMLAHLVASGKLVYGFAPRPELGGNLMGAEAVVENLMTLYRLTGKRPYAVMGGLAATWSWRQAPNSEAEKAAKKIIESLVAGTPADVYFRATEVGRPSTYQVMDAENGKAVKKAFEAHDLIYPGGTPGQSVTVGRENMFWMRFDVDREDDYYFYMVFLKSQIDGGLVSVMMRIDGDKIFQVNLGGASGQPIMDMELVEGPRHLRAGPHSFGIRFSGLLMTQPAVLDAVVVQPVLERRVVDLPNGKRLVLLNNMANEPARTTYDDIQPWSGAEIEVLDGQGQPAQLDFEEDRRRRKKYLVVPAGGIALIEWKPTHGSR